MNDEVSDFLFAPKADLDGLLKAADILGLPRLRPDVTGIYFLFKGDECVYVGKSRRLHLRVAEHMRRDFRLKDFDTYSWIACSEPDAMGLEAYYISLLRPRLNIVWSGIPHQRKPKSKPLVNGVDIDAEIAKAKQIGECSRNIKKLVRARMEENKNNNISLAKHNG